jgi:hypothetical protein
LLHIDAGAQVSTTARIAILLMLGVGLWGLATLYIHFVPAAFTSPLHSSLGFITALPIGWLSIRLVRRCARLDRSQLVAGTALVGAVAMMIDGLALRFFPWLYSGAPEIFRPASAWLLWGYGVSLAIALWLARDVEHTGTNLDELGTYHR